MENQRNNATVQNIIAKLYLTVVKDLLSFHYNHGDIILYNTIFTCYN